VDEAIASDLLSDEL